jgi:hypothetical protein
MTPTVTIGLPVAGGLGWFLLSWLVMNESAGDAAGEAVGVAFGVLIVVSVIGVLRTHRRPRSADSGEDPEIPS